LRREEVMAGIASNLSEKVLECKLNLDVLEEGIRVAKEYGLNTKSLLASKSEQIRKYTELGTKVLRSMTLSNNVELLRQGWYAVRYLDNVGDAFLLVVALQESELGLIRRDGRHERELSRADVDSLIPAIVDPSIIFSWKEDVASKAQDLLVNKLGFKVEQPKNPKAGVVPSAHARVRWVQRVVGIPEESKALDYLRIRVAEVDEAILEAYGKSTLLWTNPDGIEYWFDDNNVSFVVGSGTTIITLYEQDFGFNREINRSIVLQQIEVVKSIEQEYKDIERESDERAVAVVGELEELQGRVDLLKAEIEMLESRRATLESSKKELYQSKRYALQRFQSETGKLFRKSN
jgi:hypothetical protein